MTARDNPTVVPIDALHAARAQTKRLKARMVALEADCTCGAASALNALSLDAIVQLAEAELERACASPSRSAGKPSIEGRTALVITSDNQNRAADSDG